jgi:hypothetical protein
MLSRSITDNSRSINDPLSRVMSVLQMLSRSITDNSRSINDPSSRVMSVLQMLSRSIIDNSRSINDPYRVFRMKIIIDAPSYGVIPMTPEV